MSEDPSAVGGEMPADSQPQAGTPQTAPQAGAGEHSKPAIKTLEEAQAVIEKLQRELEKTNREAASHRIENKTLKQQQEEAERAKLSELEKAQKDAAKYQASALEAQQKLQELTVRYAVERAASRVGFNDPEDAFVLIMRSGDLEFADDGTPKNADKLLEALAKSKPYLLRQQPAAPAGISPANPSRSGQGASSYGPKNPPRLTDPNTWGRR